MQSTKYSLHRSHSLEFGQEVHHQSLGSDAQTEAQCHGRDERLAFQNVVHPGAERTRSGVLISGKGCQSLRETIVAAMRLYYSLSWL